MLRLYDHPDSTNALKVRFLLDELAVEWQSVLTPMGSERSSDTPSHSPFGLVPVLDDDGWVLTESNTILRYLADSRGRDDLYPTTARERARVDERLDALSLQVRSALWPVEAAHAAGTVTDTLRRDLEGALDGFEHLLADNGTCTGELSIADFATMGRLVHLPELPVDLGRWPRLRRLLADLSSRPSFRRARSGAK